MQEKGDAKQNMRRNVRIFTGIVVMILLLAFTSVFYRQNHKFAYGEHLDDILLSVDEQQVSLREFGYFVYEVEAFTQKQADTYNAGDPLDYWNTHFSAGINSRFVSEIARDSAIDRCLGDLVYGIMASEQGLTLSEDETKQIKQEAKDWMAALNDRQKEILQLDEALVEKVLLREALAKKAAYAFSGKADLSGYSGDVALLLSGSGEYFKDVLLPAHKVYRNEKLIAQMKFGRITVNQE